MSHKKYYTNHNSDNDQVNNTIDNIEKDIEAETETTESVELEETTEEESSVGMVSGCTKLNIRVKPDINSDVVCVVSKDTVVIIDLEESTNDWYRVFTESGFNGFCMKQYITVTN